MTTYNSYEAAKISNPDEEIYLMDTKQYRTGKWIDQHNFGRSSFTLCSPANHCMTVEKFLADGHKFVEGDIIFNSHPRPNVDFICSEDLIDYNEFDEDDDDKRYILRAAALNKPKRTGESDMGIEVVSHWVVRINNSGITSEITSETEPEVMDTKTGLFVVVASGLSKNYLNMEGARNFTIEPVMKD